MALEVVFDKFKIYHILRYIIYEFLKMFRVVLERPVWAAVGKDPLCTVHSCGELCTCALAPRCTMLARTYTRNFCML